MLTVQMMIGSVEADRRKGRSQSRYQGYTTGAKVAQLLVVYLKRTGGQSQYSALLTAPAHSESDSFAGLEKWIVENLKNDLRVVAWRDEST